MSSQPICDPADQNRCQGTTKRGQCRHLAVEGSKFCDCHQRHVDNNKERVRHYLLSNPTLSDKFERHSATEQVRSLRDEIHLARVMVEQRLDMIDDGDRGDMLAAFSSVNTYLQTIEKLVSSCHRLETSLGSLLTKASIFSLGQEIVNILADELKEVEGYEQIVDNISTRIVVAIVNQQNEK